jgi:hypothetical protein
MLFSWFQNDHPRFYFLEPSAGGEFLWIHIAAKFILQISNRCFMKRYSLFAGLVLLFVVVTVIPVTASPAISGISPSTVSNAGDVTITITGSGFNENTTVWLESSYSPNRVHGTVVSWSPTSIIVRFSLSGQTPATYDVWVNSPFTSPLSGVWYPQDIGGRTGGITIYQAAGMTATMTTTPVTTTTVTTTPLLPSGSIIVSSVPSGAHIYLDNEYKGLTTFDMRNIENGSHVILVRLPGYLDWIQSVEVRGDSQSVFARLVATPATTIDATVQPTNPTPSPTPTTTRAPLGNGGAIIATIGAGAALLLMKRK